MRAIDPSVMAAKMAGLAKKVRRGVGLVKTIRGSY